MLDLNPATPDNVDQNVNYLEELVGEGKKFRDVNELAKGKYEADRYVNTLVQQKEQLLQDYTRLKEEYETTASLREVADRIANPPQFNNRDNTPPANEPPVFDPNSLGPLVAQQVSALREQEKMQANEQVVEAKLKERFGANYGNVLKQQMEQLGLSEDYVRDMARRNPTVFFKTFDLDQPQAQDPFKAPPRSSVRSDNFAPATNKRDWSFYEKMRKDQPSLYWNSKTQVQMHKDAIALGDSFHQ